MFLIILKKECRIEQLEIIIDMIIAIKAKSDIVFLFIRISIDISLYFIYMLSFSASRF